MGNIKEYDFVDCFVVDFKSDSLISNLEVITEAYYPTSIGASRKKGLIKVVFKQVLELNISKNQEFEFDLSLPYDKDADDVRGNEIYSIEIENENNERIVVAFKSDLLKFIAKCAKLEIFEIDDY